MGTDRHWVAHVAVTLLLALGLPGIGFAQAMPSPAQNVSIKTFLPELQRLQQRGDWAGLEELSRQALSALQTGADSTDIAAADSWLTAALWGQGRYAEAEPPARRALAILEKALGPEHPSTANSLSILAELLRAQGRYAEAEPLCRRALAIREKVLGPEHPDTANSLNNLAVLLKDQGHYAEAEPLYRRTLAIREKGLGPDDPDTANSLNNLAELLRQEGRYEDAEPLYRRALAIREKALGAQHPDTAASLDNLAELLWEEGRYAEAEPLYQRALAIREKGLGPEHPHTANSLNNLAELLREEGRYGEAEPLYRRALAIREKALGAEHRDTANSLNNLAGLLRAQGQYAEAEPLYRRALAIDEKALGPDHPDTATGLNGLAELLWEEGRYAEAEPLYRRALAIEERALGPDHPNTATSLNNLAELFSQEDRYADAEPFFRRALAIREKTLGPEHPGTAASLNNLAELLWEEGRYSEAEPLYRRALAIREKALGAQHPDTATSLNNLAELLREEGRYKDADPLFRRALAVREEALGLQHPDTATAQENLGLNDEGQGRFDDATLHYRRACSALSTVSRSRTQSGDVAQAARARANACSTRLSLSLWGWSVRGGGTQVADRPEALRVEAFAASQRAVQSAAGDALSRSAALTAAKSTAVGPQAVAYEAALRERDNLDQQFAEAVGESGEVGVEKRQALAKAHDAVVSKIGRLATQLKTQASLYWDYRSPDAVSVAALQAKSGADAVLLHDDEALIVFLVAPGKDKGLAFAVSKDQFAWAQLALTGDELKTRVIRLRAQIDPEGYGMRGLARIGEPGVDANPGAFNRQSAYEVYQALLGDASIQAVIRNKAVLLFVPSGPLTSLPPGLLVTAPPEGGVERDTNPAALRATAWLLRSKAVALLPAVSSLRTLRQILPTDRASTPDPLLAFADPDFNRPAAAAKPRAAGAAARGFTTYFRDGVPLAEALDGLPSLPGTRVEGEALERALRGRPGSLLIGRDASKAQLMARNGDGRLADVRVLEFATHGLVAGDASELAEPALALAAGPKPEDELLLASEAATLKLNAEWVLLSACNTASPDAPEAQGLSGLSRAFFYAGARSLLVSHWRVRDDVAPRLIPAMLLAAREHPALSRAQALREASLAILDDRSLNAVDPAAWAPFTLIGEAGR